jgi:hypothetical protein
VADAGERLDRRSGDAVEVLRRVAEALDESVAGLEVELVLGLERDLPLRVLDAPLQLALVSRGRVVMLMPLSAW